jgi:glycosyltransferase involved in cell wall biosynthesis
MTHTPSNWPSEVFILIPSYKSAPSLETFLPQVVSIIPAKNICVIDDGSHDETETVCQKLDILYTSLSVNCGKGRALTTGFDFLIKNYNASWILTMDADGQHAVSDVQHFLSALKKAQNCGIIIGNRSMKPGTMPLARIVSNTLTSRILTIATGNKILDSQCGFRAYSTTFLKTVTCRYPRFEMESEIILRACAARFSVLFIPVQTLYCSTTSHISHIADTLRWIRAVVCVWAALRKHTH